MFILNVYSKQQLTLSYFHPVENKWISKPSLSHHLKFIITHSQIWQKFCLKSQSLNQSVPVPPYLLLTVVGRFSNPVLVLHSNTIIYAFKYNQQTTVVQYLLSQFIPNILY